MLPRKLKEDPREWRKFVAGFGSMLVIVGVLLWRRKILTLNCLYGVMGVVVLALLASWLRPGWFRGFYRAGMTVFSLVGQVVGKILLAIFFVLGVTPLGVLLRLTGKDLLALKRKPEAQTYWLPGRNNDEFDRMF